MIEMGTGIAADFGSLGLWIWNAGSWTLASGADPVSMGAGNFDGARRRPHGDDRCGAGPR